MVQRVTTFKSDNGKTFDTEFDAWCEELRAFLVSNGADNDAIARKIVAAVSDGRPETLSTLANIVGAMRQCAPPMPPVILCRNCQRLYAASDSSCPHCGEESAA